MHLNVQGITTNFNEVESIVLNNSFEIIALTETHLTENINDSEISLANYSTVRCDSTSRKTGGVVLYIKKNFQYRLLDKSSVPMKIWIVCVEIYYRELNETVAVVYRSPNSSEREFCDYFSDWLDKLLRTRINIVIMGDFNINLLLNNTYAKAIREIFVCNNVKQIVANPTRITSTSRSLIDLVIVPVESRTYAEVAPNLKVSDHESVVVKIPIARHKPSRGKIFIDIFKYNKSHFKSIIAREGAVLDLSDFNLLSKGLQEALEECVKVLTVKKRVYSCSNKWFTNDLNELKVKKIQCYKKASIYNIIDDWYEYRRLRNLYRYKLQLAKKRYICNKIENCANQKEMWKSIKKLVLKEERFDISEVQFTDNIANDKSIIANKFNSYFIESINKISNSIPRMNTIDSNFRESNSVFKFRQINVRELWLICKSINKKKDSTSLNIEVILDCFEIVGPIIVRVINDSFKFGEFPRNLKESIVIPIPKENNTIQCDKFRPINMMPILEKIVEKTAYNQFYKYVINNKILIDNQSGFRPGHSCETSLNWLIMTLKEQRHEGNKIIAVFLDFQRAFETIHRKRLVEKLCKYGVKETELSWFKSYLSNRTQRTKIGNVFSNIEQTTFGVPQGTILGPLLFLIYINDISCIMNNSTLSLFADDALMFVGGKNVNAIKQNIESDLNSLYEWLNMNKLKLNVGKTKCMVMNCEFNVNLKINGEDIQQVREIKYLGVKLDSELNFKGHMDYITKKISKKIGFLRRIRKNITTMCAINIYNTIIKPHFEFCSTILYMGNIESIRRLQILQNKAMRSILNCGYYTSIEWMLSCLRWMSINQRIVYNAILFVFKMKHKMVPEYLSSNLQYIQDVQPYSLRSNSDFHLQFYRDSRTQNMLMYKGLKQFNDLPSVIKNENVFRVFKKLLIDHIKSHIS